MTGEVAPLIIREVTVTVTRFTAKCADCGWAVDVPTREEAAFLAHCHTDRHTRMAELGIR